MTQSHLTPAHLNQMRRDAKRLGREQGLSHSQALDQLAQTHGFQNWSQLARHSQDIRFPDEMAFAASPDEPDTSAETATAGLQLRPSGLQMPRMEATRGEMSIIVAIAKRYEAILGGGRDVDRLSLLMDLEACHCNGCPLDLVSLLEASRDMDLVHDVAGISRHLNRETGQLEGLFRPRYAMQEHSVSS